MYTVAHLLDYFRYLLFVATHSGAFSDTYYILFSAHFLLFSLLITQQVLQIFTLLYTFIM
jgi:hypothetical protein